MDGVYLSVNITIYTIFTNKHTKNSLSRVGVRLWNKIPEDLRKMSKKKFKEKLRSLLFNNLEKLGYNAEISKLDFSYPLSKF